MPWAKLDDRMPWSRKIQPLSDRAFRLYITGIAFCAAELTDGFISDANVALLPLKRGRTDAARELVANKLWEEVEGGYMVHDFLDYNRSAARMKQERKATAARQARFKGKSNGVSNGDGDAVTDGVTELDDPPIEEAGNGVSNAAPSRPVPSRPSSPNGDEPPAAVPAAPSAKPKRKPRTTPDHPVADELTAAFWERHKANTAQSFIAVRSCIRTAISNGVDRNQLAHALDQLAKDGKPVSGGTIQFAMSQRNGTGHQAYRNPDIEDYYGELRA